MNGKELFLSFQYVGEDLVAEAEVFRFAPSASQKKENVDTRGEKAHTFEKKASVIPSRRS